MRGILALLGCCIMFAAASEPSLAAGQKGKPKAARPSAASGKERKAPPPRATARPAAAAEDQSPLQKAVIGPDKGEKPPVFIRSATVHLDSKARVFTYRKDVEIVRGDLRITAEIVTGKYSEANEIELITCEQNVVITRGANLKASSNRAVYDVPAAKIVLTESPELNDRGNVLSADKVTLFVNEDRSEAEGNVRVKVTKSEGSSFGSALGPEKSGGS